MLWEVLFLKKEQAQYVKGYSILNFKVHYHDIEKPKEEKRKENLNVKLVQLLVWHEHSTYFSQFFTLIWLFYLRKNFPNKIFKQFIRMT